ncbi:thioredoxin family protein [Fodinibius sp.]|uniref:thioredoxin family protein n=1 Tax=Fodinibius sp. TaxID=1872440 RepID=UPI002ACE9708|nr:thioredoxin family protein [Fodinibius sp.]MDZ7659370.1 thioredoxin family protein [Fodinibius sp.]
MKKIKILGPGCPKCKATHQNVLKALESLQLDADVQKVEDMEEMLKYDVMTTPVLLIDETIHIKGRVAQVSEIKELLKQ